MPLSKPALVAIRAARRRLQRHPTVWAGTHLAPVIYREVPGHGGAQVLREVRVAMGLDASDGGALKDWSQGKTAAQVVELLTALVSAQPQPQPGQTPAK